MQKKLLIFFIILISFLAYGAYHLEEGIVEQGDSISFQHIQESTIATSSSENVARQDIKKEIKVTLAVNENLYTTEVAGNSNVIDVMTHLSSTTLFRYGAKQYSGMGAFIEEINGVRNGKGLYWILYVNGNALSVGASSYIVHEGDRIEWKFEKSK